MSKKIKVTTNSDAVFNADQAVKSFVKSHGKKLSDDERNELGGLLRNRAKAMSDALGIVASIILSLESSLSGTMTRTKTFRFSSSSLSGYVQK